MATGSCVTVTQDCGIKRASDPSIILALGKGHASPSSSSGCPPSLRHCRTCCACPCLASKPEDRGYTGGLPSVRRLRRLLHLHHHHLLDLLTLTHASCSLNHGVATPCHTLCYSAHGVPTPCQAAIPPGVLPLSRLVPPSPKCISIVVDLGTFRRLGPASRSLHSLVCPQLRVLDPTTNHNPPTHSHTAIQQCTRSHLRSFQRPHAGSPRRAPETCRA